MKVKNYSDMMMYLTRPDIMPEDSERFNFKRGGKVFEPKLDVFEDIVLKFNQGTEYKSVKDVLAEYTKRTKDPFTKKMVSKGLTTGTKAAELINPVISLLETPEDKVNRVFAEALSTDTPVDVSVVDKAKVKVAARASTWRADIANKTNLDQAFVNRILNKNPDYIKNKKLFNYLGQSQLLLTDLKDLPLKDQLTYAGEALKGRPVYKGIKRSGQTRIMRDPAHKVMEFALRNFNANEGKGAVKFFDKNGKPIKYKTGLNIPYRDSIISYKGKKHTVADLRKPGYMQKFFPNVYDNQIKINKILNQEVNNPFKKGKKINFGDLMTEVQVKGYGWSPRAGSIDLLHGPAGVKGDPFDNLTFGTKRLNYQLEDINKLYRFGKINDASRLKLLDAATGNLKGLQGDDLLNAVVKQEVNTANQIAKGKTFGTTRQETEKLIKKVNLPKLGKVAPVVGAILGGTGAAQAGPLSAEEAVAAEGAPAPSSPLPTALGAGAGAAAIGTKTGRSLLGKAFRTLGTPIAGPAFAATNVAAKMGEGQSFADAVVDPLTGLELSFPGLFKESVSAITKNPTAQKILSLGRFGRMLTPVGLGLAGLGQAQEFYNQYQDLQKMKRDDPEAYQQFRSQRVGPALTEEDYKDIYSDVQGAAGGGIMKEGGIESGPQRVSMNPDSEGLASLLKRGSKS